MSSLPFQFNREFSISFEEASWHYHEETDEVVLRGKNNTEIRMTFVQFEFFCKDSMELIHLIGAIRSVGTQEE